MFTVGVEQKVTIDPIIRKYAANLRPRRVQIHPEGCRLALPNDKLLPAN